MLHIELDDEVDSDGVLSCLVMKTTLWTVDLVDSENYLVDSSASMRDASPA